MRTTVLTACLLAMAMTTAKGQTFIVDTDSVYQQIDGFGASDAWSMQTVGLMDENTQQRVGRWLFSRGLKADGSPEGIGLSIWRMNIGAGSSEQGERSGINPGTRTECLMRSDGSFDWNRQKGQRRFLRLAKDYGVENLIGFLNSPPVYYTKNGLATNTGRGGTYNLREECYGDFARFMGSVIDSLRTHDGIKLNWISPVNEPDGHWNWLGPKQEGTPATKQEIARIVRLLDGELTRRGLDTKIIIPESSDYRCMMSAHMTGADRGYEIQSFFSEDSTDTWLGGLSHVPRIMAGHSYWTNTPVRAMRMYREQLRDSLAKYGVGLWQSEVCIMGNDEEIGGGGGYDRTMKTALYVARMIHHDMVFANARTWQWWRAVGGDYKDGLLFEYRPKGAAADTIVDSKLLWALGNYSRFVRPGAVRIGVKKDGRQSPTEPYGLMCSAYRNSDGQVVVVMINYSDRAREVNMRAPRKGRWQVYRTSDGESLKYIGLRDNKMTMPPRSITTLVR